MAATSVEVSIIVTAWRDAPQLLGCLETLAATGSAVSREVLVTLNEPAPSLAAALEARPELYDGLEVADANRGFGIANNDAAARAAGSVLFFLNDDALVTPGWLDPLFERLAGDPTIGAAASVQVDEAGELVEAGAFVYSDGAPVQINAGLLDGEPVPPGPALYASAAALAVRREAFEAVGGFDPGYYPAYYEDVDLALKLLGQGLVTWIEPTSVVCHGHEADGRLATFLSEANRQRLLERWGPQLERLPEHPGSARVSGTRRDAAEVRAAIAELVWGGRFAPAIADEPRPTDDELGRRTAELPELYTGWLADRLTEREERVSELEDRERHYQVLVAERDDVLSRYVPRLAELEVMIPAFEQQIAERDEQIAALERQHEDDLAELAAFRERRVVRLADKAQGMVRRLRLVDEEP
jgi:GT2 family glycosyltransferase